MAFVVGNYLIKVVWFLPCLLGGCYAFAVQLYVGDENDFIIYQGLNPTTNIANSTNSLIINALPSNKITFVPASYPRALKAMRTSEEAVCIANKVKNKSRLNEFLFSLPVSIYLSRRLYQHATEQPLSEFVFTEEGEIKSLPELFDLHTDALIVFTPTMSYGPFFDKQFANIARENKVYRVGSNPYDDMYNLFRSKRADFLLGYPAEVYRRLQEEQVAYREYHVANAPRYIIGYWMCNNNESSKAFLALFNSLMVQIYKQASFYDAHLQWLPKTSQKQTNAYLDELIRLLTPAEN